MNASVAPAGDSALALLRLVLRFNLHPQACLHPSWLPADWPVSARARLARLAPEAQALLRDALVRAGVLAAEPDHAFDSPVKRLLLLDAPALRRLAFYASLCVHAPLMRPRRDALAARNVGDLLIVERWNAGLRRTLLVNLSDAPVELPESCHAGKEGRTVLAASRAAVTDECLAGWLS